MKNYPILYEAGETAFENNGLGMLTDVLGCMVHEERNGAYYLEMDYPINGAHANDLENRRIIFAKPNKFDEPQPFRIQQIVKSTDRTISIYAPHISYDLSGTPCEPFTAANVQEAMQLLKSKQIQQTPFTFQSDKQTVATMTNTVPTSCRALLGGHEGSALDVYGGEYEFDRFSVILHASRGEDRGAALRYGKNIAQLEQEQDISSLYTAVYPFWQGTDGKMVTLPEKTVQASGTYSFSRIKAQDFSDDFEEAPTESQLRAKCQSYIATNKVGVPKVTLDVDPKMITSTDVIKLCDTVHIYFDAFGIETSAEVISTEYNPILDEYDVIEIGEPRYTFIDAVVDSQNYVKNAAQSVQEAVNIATGKIVGNVGGYVVLNSSTGGKVPDEILVMDAPNIENAVSVWRWNKSGLGHSSNGYNGPYTLAALDDGSFVADVIKSGTLSSIDGSVQISLNNGAFSCDGVLSDGAAVKVEIKDGQVRFYKSGELVGRLLAMGNQTLTLTAGAGRFVSVGGAAGSGFGNLSSRTNIIGSEIWLDQKKVAWEYSDTFGKYVLTSTTGTT